MNRIYHVAKNGCDLCPGTEAQPFLTISKAAAVAEKGDTIIVHEGVYREWVDPKQGGCSDICRITYEAAEGEKVVIKGSEQIDTWEPVEGNVWKAVLPNSMFGDFNPYKEPLDGDWYIYPTDKSVHHGDVYLNGVSFYEAKSLEEVKNPQKRETGFTPPWSRHVEYILHPEQTVYQYFAEVDHENTTIYANFQGADPNKELVEINVRQYCFYPSQTGMDYITVRGFEMAQAASPWAPPTADQPGLLGVHWSKGWIIENNIIHDAKCSAISLGKEISTGHNMCTRTEQKPGYQYQMEAVFRGLQIGWSKEKIGSHIVRNNVIYDCGQNGVVGHMGCAFSQIYGNHIYNIAVKHEYFGYEIAGIKLHAAIDVQIHDNNIHNCTLGTWLDWEAQGTRVSGNLYYENDRDLMIEVTHGPCMVDNNIFASQYNFDNVAQGTAFIHNLCCGSMRRVKVLDRSTPYHFPHSTQVLGTALVFSGDDRLYNNIFLGGQEVLEDEAYTGTAGYDGCMPSYEAYIEKMFSYGIEDDHEKFFHVEQPAYINGNAYFKDAKACTFEQDNYCTSADPKVRITQEDGSVYLEIDIPEEALQIPTEIQGTRTLGNVRIVDAIFEDPDGKELILDVDYTGAKRGERPVAGPIEGLKAGANRIKIWG